MTTLVMNAFQKKVPSYVESLLDRNETIAEYFVCASCLQTQNARSVLQDIQIHTNKMNFTQEESKNIVDKIFIRAALNCIEKFQNLTREKKLSVVNLTMESVEKTHLEDLFHVNHTEILEIGNFELTLDELEYKTNVANIQRNQQEEKTRSNKEKNKKFEIKETAEELKKKNSRLEEIIKEKITYVENDSFIHHAILAGILCSVFPTILCHYCFCRKSGEKEIQNREISRVKRELEKEGKIYTKEFDGVEKRRKQLKQTVEEKFKIGLDEFLEKKRKEAKEKEEEEGGEEVEENLKERNK